jgi:hypothetical protein
MAGGEALVGLHSQGEEASALSEGCHLVVGGGC